MKMIKAKALNGSAKETNRKRRKKKIISGLKALNKVLIREAKAGKYSLQLKSSHYNDFIMFRWFRINSDLKVTVNEYDQDGDIASPKECHYYSSFVVEWHKLENEQP